MISWTRLSKKLFVIFFDCLICLLTVWLSYCLKFEKFVFLEEVSIWAFLLSSSLVLSIFLISGPYNIIFHRSGLASFKTLSLALVVYFVSFAAIVTFFPALEIPISVGFVQPLIFFCLLTISRAIPRVWIDQTAGKKQLRKIAIFGAGESGYRLGLQLINHKTMELVAYFDDDKSLQNQYLNGVKIHPPTKLDEVSKAKNIDEVFLSIPSVGRARRSELVSRIRNCGVSIREIPTIGELVAEKMSLPSLQDLDLGYILGRGISLPRKELLEKNILNKVVVVSGAGGSIGSELCHQIHQWKPRRLILVEQNEFALYEIHRSLTEIVSNEHIEIIPLLLSVTDREGMRQMMGRYRPDTLYHAAAHKHVPLLEMNALAAIKNNVFGTLITVETSIEFHVSNFVLISSDKAVRPTNVMGATKRIAELIVQAQAKSQIETTLSMVRFGNVLGSSGSVIPKFIEQLKRGGPLTVTHPEVTRYFMTIPEAAQLVIQAGGMAQGGEVFVLDMGPSVKIINIAKKVIEFSGFSVRDEKNLNGDIEISITGLRPGEKLHEELLIDNRPEPTEHPSIMQSFEESIDLKNLIPKLERLEIEVNIHDEKSARETLSCLVPDFTPQSNTVN
jgi:FlaA1/EpsC-like NDP-sugar epimerase